MTLYDALKHKNHAHAFVGSTRYSVTRVTVASAEGYAGQAAGYRVNIGCAPYGEYTDLDTIEENCRDTRGSYSQWKYATWQ